MRIKKTPKIILATLITSASLFGYSSNGFAQTKKPSKEALVEYITKEDFKNKVDGQTLPDNTFYYHNNINDPTTVPLLGEDEKIKFIKLKETGKEYSDLEKTKEFLTRYIKIYQSNTTTPKNIEICFNIKLEKTPTSGWETGNTAVGRLTINFTKKGIASTTKFDSNQKGDIANKGWIKENVKLSIPSGAEYLVMNLSVSKGESISLANWEIK